MQCRREGRLTDAATTRSRQIKARGSELDWVSNKPSQMEIRELLVLSVALEVANERNACISKHRAGLRTLQKEALQSLPAKM